jgi:hypothetical protein
LSKKAKKNFAPVFSRKEISKRIMIYGWSMDTLMAIMEGR